MKNIRFYKCQGCQDILFRIGNKEENCCDSKLELITENTVEASHEKHIPEVSRQAGNTMVKVGSMPHPMVPEHSIEWIFVQTNAGGILYNLSPGDKPEALFTLDISDVISVYAYCNLHGLWKTVPNEIASNTDIICSAEFSGGCVSIGKDE